MDRNLGALATDCTQAAAKGLYYQWGRKDPFPYPALATDAYTQAPTVYAPGFEYAESNPRTSGAESPYDVMTLRPPPEPLGQRHDREEQYQPHQP